MSLCNVYGYLNGDGIAKTIKLSDSYQVRLRLEDSDFALGVTNASKSKYALNINQPDNNEIELFECTSVTLPAYKPKEDIFEYGNNSKSFIYMDPKSLDDLEIELIEHYSDNNTLVIQDLVNLFLSKLFNEDTFEYILNDYIPELTVYVFSNIFSTIYLKYIFKELKLTNYTKYDLDYSSTDLAKWSLKFSYRSFEVISGEELAYAEEITNNLNNDTNSGDDEQTEIEETVSTQEPALDNPALEENKKEDRNETPVQNVATEQPENNQPETPASSNDDLKNQFNATGAKPEGEPAKKKATDNPVDLGSLTGEDRIDELAYRMMRGELDNGKPRYGKTYEAGYTEEERKAAQSVVNQKDWQGLKERHDARVANMTNVANTEVAAVQPQEPLTTNMTNVKSEGPVQEMPQPKAKNNKRTVLTYSNDQYEKIKDNMSVNDLLTKHSNDKSGDYTATVASVYMDNDSRIGNGKIAGKDFVSQNTVNEINATGKAKAEIIDIKASNVDELKESLNKLSENSKKDNSLYVVGVDASNMSGLTKTLATKVGGEQTEKAINEGYAVPIYKGKVGDGVGDADKGLALAGASIDEHPFIANRALNNGVEVKAMKITKTEEKKPEPKEPTKPYQNDNGPKYVNGVQDKNGLTLNQWAYLTAKNDYEAETDKEAKNKKGYKGYNFSLGSTAVPIKQKMEFQKRYHEEMEKFQNPSPGAASYTL